MIDEVKTYRGRSLDEVLPKIREELGPDAIVLRRREGLSGGVGGFFQRAHVEVEARPAPADDAPAPELRSDRATAEGLSSPGVQALIEQAAPFAATLAEAAAKLSDEESPGLYGPQPTLPAPDALAPDPVAAGSAGAADGSLVMSPEPLVAPVASRSAEPVAAPAAPSAPEPAGRARWIDALVECGLPQWVASAVVGEASIHARAFGSPRAMKSNVRAALAKRISVLGPLPTKPRTIALVGGPASGRTTAAARLANAYGDAAKVLDAPAKVARGAEVHVALPATLSAAAAAEVLDRAAAMRPTHVVLTFADQTSAAGAVIGTCIKRGLPISYVSGEALEPADAAALARMLVP